VAALRAARVSRVLPAHCSGWRAVHAIARAMPRPSCSPRWERP
jgi:metal-dependent hydrolase (beta-lactamase superfamily II)